MVLLNNPVAFFSGQERHVETSSTGGASVAGYQHLVMNTAIYPFQLSTGSDLEGSYRLLFLEGVNVKRSRVVQVRLDLSSILINAEIESNTQKFQLEVSLENQDLLRNLQCPLDVSILNPGFLQLKLKYSEMFKDNSEGSFLSQVSQRVGAGTQITINSTLNTDLLKVFQQNLYSSEFLGEYKCSVR